MPWAWKKGRNPKRDGSPTRGELRQGKYRSYLGSIAQAGREAERALGEIVAAPVLSRAAVTEYVPEVHASQVREAAPAVAREVEHAEAGFLRARIDELGVLHADLMSQIAEMAEQDGMEYDAIELQEQATKIAHQRGLLRAKAKGLGIKTNPPRSSKVLIGLHRYGQALRRLRSAIRRR